ncbi:MAG: tetratricopeptide repeat protein [Microscillaceae bacterium]|jgi:tetratricopeptide (TPR) repeat protein|nr:tetratricopeptide repeat protein [Microscillaceae bacterium]
MDKFTLINLLDNPHTISENDLESLEEIAASYPYCQTAHLLIAKYAHDRESMLTNQKVRRAAIYALDRNLLRRFVNQVAEDSEPSTTNAQAELNGTQIADNQATNSQSSISALLLDHDEPDDTKSFFEMIELDEPNEKISETITEPLSQTPSSFTFIDDNTVQFNLDKSPDNQILSSQELPLEIIAETPTTPRDEVAESLEQVIDHTTLLADNQTFNEQFVATQPETDPFFADIENLPHVEGHEIYEDINVGKALGLFYDDKISESIRMFNQLMRLYPAKKAEYEEELLDLLGKKAHLYNLQTGELKSAGKPTLTITNPPQEDTPEQNPNINIQNSDNQVVSNTFETNITEVSDLNVDAILPNVAYEKPDDLSENTSQSIDNEVVSQSDFNAFSLEERDLPLENLPDLNGFNSSESTAQTWSNDLAEKPLETSAGNLEDTTHSENSSSFFDQIAENEPFNEEFKQSFTPNTHITEVSVEAGSVAKEVLSDLTDFKPKTTNLEIEKNYFTESEAILLFNQGKNAEAIKIYESLINRNPQKSAYYQSQIKVLQGMDMSRLRETEQNINLAVETSEDFSEAQALQLFTQGNTQEAVAIYEQLMNKYPEKRAYFISQIEILKS